MQVGERAQQSVFFTSLLGRSDVQLTLGPLIQSKDPISWMWTLSPREGEEFALSHGIS